VTNCRTSSPFHFATALVVATTHFLVAQTPTNGTVPAKSAVAPVIKERPVIDGKLNDAAWNGIAPLTGFVQRELREGDPVSERTEVRVFTDGDALYIGAWLFDRDAAAIVQGERIRDVALDNSDAFALILDTFHDRQNGFLFATTPAGIEYDGQVSKEGEGGGVVVQGQGRAVSGSMGGFNLNWDGNWTVATSADAQGWYAEFRIPFSTLRYGSGAQQTWGVNFSRRIRRKNEDAYWAFIPRQFSIYRLSRAGTVQIPQLPVQRLARATPYVLGGANRDFTIPGSKTRRTRDWGVDAKYGVTASLTLDATYNTDFAQVEVDEQRTNLTRFSLFFPEKRPFFLENAGAFSAGTPQAVDLFFTRRIGIDAAGQPVPILGGGRLSGRVGTFTVGALAIATDDVPGVQHQQAYSVGRVTREFGSRSRLGAIAVQRNDLDSARSRNSTVGIDGRVGLGEAWTFDGWAAKTETPSRARDDYGFSARANYASSKWNNTARVIRVGEDFVPEVGFLNRLGGYEYFELAAQRMVRSERLEWLKQWAPHMNYRGYYKSDGYWLSSTLHVDMTEVEWAKGGRFGPDMNVYHEGLRAPFPIATGVTLPVGSYDFATFGFDWATNPSQPFSMVLRADAGPFYNGTRRGGTTTFTFRRGAALSTSLLLDYNDVRLNEGNFIRQIIGTRVAYFFTPSLSVQSLMQYNKEAKVWTANTRLAWLNTAGTGLFIVWNDGETANGFFDWQRPQNRSLVIKYAQQFGTSR
jgi:hypothetical protein